MRFDKTFLTCFLGPVVTITLLACVLPNITTYDPFFNEETRKPVNYVQVHVFPQENYTITEELKGNQFFIYAENRRVETVYYLYFYNGDTVKTYHYFVKNEVLYYQWEQGQHYHG